MDFGIFLGVTILAILIISAALIFSFKTMWRIADPNEALIISGVKDKDPTSSGFKIVTGGGVFVKPGIERVSRISLRLREALLAIDCVTSQGIEVGIKAVVIFKIGDNAASISNAVRRFLDQDDKTIDRNIQNMLAGHLRSIVGGLTVAKLFQNREALATESLTASSGDIEKLGLIIDSFQISDIIDPTGYIEKFSQPHIAEVTKQARIAQALANQEATLAEQTAAAKIADATRDSEILRAGYQADVDKAKEESKQAGPLARAIAEQNVKKQATITAELNAQLAEQDLQATVRKPADAAAYAITVQAKAERDAAISRAEAEAQKTSLESTASAKAIQTIGEAEGAAVRAKLLAEADGKKALAEALAANSEAVMSQMMVERMPEIVAAAAVPFSHIKNFNVLNGADGVMQNLTGIIASASAMLPTLRGAFQTIVQPKSKKDE